MRAAALASQAFAALVALSIAREAAAGARQFTLGPALGGFYTSGLRGAIGGSVGAAASYGLSDSFRLYGNLDYRLGLNPTDGSPHQAASLAAGVAYTFDVLSVVPWIGVGGEAAMVFTPHFVGFVPAVEARGGFDWLLTRYFGLTFQGGYGFVLANRGSVGDNIMVLVGLRWAVDL